MVQQRHLLEVTGSERGFSREHINRFVLQIKTNIKSIFSECSTCLDTHIYSYIYICMCVYVCIGVKDVMSASEEIYKSDFMSIESVLNVSKVYF